MLRNPTDEEYKQVCELIGFTPAFEVKMTDKPAFAYQGVIQRVKNEMGANKHPFKPYFENCLQKIDFLAVYVKDSKIIQWAAQIGEDAVVGVRIYIQYFK